MQLFSAEWRAVPGALPLKCASQALKKTSTLAARLRGPGFYV